MVKAVVGATGATKAKERSRIRLLIPADVVIRSGGANAGHTIVNQYGKFALHTLPSGVFHQNVMNIIGNGVALNVPILFKEMQNIIEKGVPRTAADDPRQVPDRDALSHPFRSA